MPFIAPLLLLPLAGYLAAKATDDPSRSTAESSSTHNSNSISSQSDYARLRCLLKGMKNIIWRIAVSPDSLNIAAGGEKGEVRIWPQWTISDGAGFIVKQPSDGTGCVCSISFSPNGKHLAAAIDKTVHLWTVKTGQPKFDLNMSDIVLSIAFSPDNKQIACGTKDIQIWNLPTRQLLHVLKGHTNYIMGLSYFPASARMLATGSPDGTIRTWSLDKIQFVWNKWKGEEGKRIWCCALSPDGKILASGDEDKQVILWDVETGDWIARPYQGHSESVTSVSFSPDGKYIASASCKGTNRDVHITDINSNSLVAKLDGGYLDATFTPDGKYILTVDSTDLNVVRVMELTTPAVSMPPPEKTTQGPSSSTESTTSATLSPDSGVEATVGDAKLPPSYEDHGKTL